MLGWLQWQGEKHHVSSRFNIIFLSPANDWIHDCIQNCTWDWTRECDSALNASVVWPKGHQVIISMLWMKWFADFASWAKPRKKLKVKTLKSRMKKLFPYLCLFLYFLSPNSTPFWVLTVQLSYAWREPKIHAMPGSSVLQLSSTIFKMITTINK